MPPAGAAKRPSAPTPGDGTTGRGRPDDATVSLGDHGLVGRMALPWSPPGNSRFGARGRG
jgi:hypothetical protein